MTTQEELQMFTKAYDALNKIPNDYRSQNHTAYIKELESRIYELASALEYIN